MVDFREFDDEIKVTFQDMIKGDAGHSPVMSGKKVDNVNSIYADDKKLIDVLDGKDGKTPVKGVDYFDGKDGHTPIKGVDYNDGHTPIMSGGKVGDVSTIYADGEPLISVEDGNSIDVQINGSSIVHDGVANITWQSVEDALGYEPAKNAEFDEAKRKLDALWDLNNGISYRFETDSSAGNKVVPSGAKTASVDMIGGQTRKGYQLIDPEKMNIERGAMLMSHDGFDITITANIDARTYSSIAIEEYTDASQFIGKTIYVYVDDIIADKGQNGCFRVRAIRADSTWAGVDCTESKNFFSFVVPNDAVRIDVQFYSSYSTAPTDANFKTIYKKPYFGLTNSITFEPYTEELISASVDSVVESGVNLVGETFKDDSGNVVMYPVNIPVGTNVYLSMEYATPSRHHVNFYYEDGTLWDFWMASVARPNYRTVSTSTAKRDIRFVSLREEDNEGAKVMCSVNKNSFNNYIPYHEPNIHEIPAAVKALDGYGWGIGDVANTIERDADGKWWYVKRINSVDLESLSWQPAWTNAFFNDSLSDALGSAEFRTPAILEHSKYIVESPTAGIPNRVNLWKSSDGGSYNRIAVCTGSTEMPKGILLYQLKEPIRIDITNLMQNVLDPFTCEAGNEINFRYPQDDSYNIDVPNSVEYFVALNEV